MIAENVISDFINELGQRVSGDLRSDTYSRILYSTDASIYQTMPHAVLIPRSMDDVQAAVECAIKYQVPLLPRTGGSSLAGQAVNEALVIDMTRHLDQILEINAEERWVRVQPGIVLDQLNNDLRSYGLQFGPDPASSNRAAMGGIVSNNSTGSHSIMYGMTADHVMETRVILTDGSIAHFQPLSSDQLRQHQAKAGLEGDLYRRIDQLVTENTAFIQDGTPRHWRRCGGYNLDRFLSSGVNFHHERDERFNLASLISGAEGTLGVITEIKLNLVPLPRKTALAIVHFDDLFTALSAVPAMLEVGPAAVELLDNMGLRQCRTVPEYARLLETFVEGEPNCVLITEFYGESESELQAKVDHLQVHMDKQAAGAIHTVPVMDPAHQRDVWTVRKVGLGFLMSVKGDHKPIPFIEDAAVPTDHLAEYVTKVEQFCHELGTDVGYYAHASAGCLHIRPLVNTKIASEIAKLPQIMDFSVDLLKGYGGSLSSEHGDGRARSWANKRFFGPELYGLYQEVKRAFDPQNLMNPGNVVDAPPMTEKLRYGADYSVIPVDTVLNFDSEQGFHRAVEMCNGAGICRKLTTGTMCPSFMATREEEHSTRGRANALRAALSGRLPSEEFTSPRMYEVMDLCVSCKACKSECPSSVDMAKIKAEFTAQYYKKHGVPLRSRIFGNIARFNRLNSGPLAPVINSVMRSGPVRAVMNRVLDIHPNRELPAFASQPFTAWFKKHKPQAAHARRQVVLFNDTFNTYNDPHIAIAATEVLEASGHEVILPGHGCCGRPMMSNGLFDAARASARDTIDKLAPYALQGLPIIFLEPSCQSALMDDYFYLIPDHPNLQVVADQVLGFEEYIAHLADEGLLNLEFEGADRQILLHGHCHQKALVGTKPSHAALTLPQNYRLEEVDSSCCGMAGSFGYEAEHYDISMKMAERRLLPAVNAADAETIIVAPGTSCRHQIAAGTGRTVLHPAEVLRNAMKS